MAPWILALFLAFVPAFASAGTFDMAASADRTEVELGESLQFTLTVTVHGDLAYQPLVPTAPTFEGFQAQGPSQSYSSLWVNGASTLVYTFTWELEAEKPGRWTIGPIHATAKDALNGDINKDTLPIVVTVRRPKGLSYPVAAASPPPPTEEPEPTGTLRDIKGDRALPWPLVGAAFAGLLGLLGLLALLAQRRAPQEKEEPMPADPAQAALLRLDRALQAYNTNLDGKAYVVAAGEAVRVYLRQRLGLRQGLTLSEGIQALRAQAPHVEAKKAPLLRQRLELLLYAGSEFLGEDRERIDQDARDLILGLEKGRRLSPDQQALSKTLASNVEAWRQGQVKSAWMGMRSAMQAHLRRLWGPGYRTVPKRPLAAALKPFGAPELLRTLDVAFADAPPKGLDPQELADRFLRLAQAADAADLGAAREDSEEPEGLEEPGENDPEAGPADEGDA